jgi:hypothetical protein
LVLAPNRGVPILGGSTLDPLDSGNSALASGISQIIDKRDKINFTDSGRTPWREL